VTEAASADIEAVKIVMARYFRFMDTKQWDLLRGILADDMSMAAPDDVADSEPLVGADRVVRMVERVLGSAVTTHRGYLPEIELDGSDHAHGVWAMDDLVEFAATPDQSFRGCGHYHATYVRTDDGWKIQSLELRRLRLDSV
jgi:hypothetical protein